MAPQPGAGNKHASSRGGSMLHTCMLPVQQVNAAASAQPPAGGEELRISTRDHEHAFGRGVEDGRDSEP